MKKVKIYKKVIDELDIIKEISKLITEELPEQGFNYFAFDLSDAEYEDENHIFHYANDLLNRCFESLGFIQDDVKPYIFTKGELKFAYKLDNKNNEAIIQRQS